MDELSIQLAPNPTRIEHTISINLGSTQPAEVAIKLFNSLGQDLGTIYSNQMQGELNLKQDISHLNNGVYLYKIWVGDKIKSIRFVKG